MRKDYDSYGTRLAGNDHVVILIDNDLFRYAFYLPPFGPENFCYYYYSSPLNFVFNVAIGQQQNESYLTFVYLRTAENDSDYLELGTFNIDKNKCLNYPIEEQAGETFARELLLYIDDVSILKVDPTGEYAYGFLHDASYIFDINKADVKIISLARLLPEVDNFLPRDIDISITNDGVRIAVLVGYFAVDFDSTLPAVYLLCLEPPSNMFLLDNLTLINDKVVGSTFTYNYNFDYVMSVSIEHNTQQVIVGLPYFSKTFLLKFNSTKITLIKTFPQSARSVAWIDNKTQAALLLSDTPTMPWASSQVQIINTSAQNTDLATIYAIPNNQQTIDFRSPKQSIDFIRITVSNGQPVILTSTPFVIYAPVASAGYFIGLTEITSYAPSPKSCPAGTFKNYAGPSPCIVCPTGFKKVIDNASPLSTNFECIPCTSSSYCPLASVNDVNISMYPTISQAYAYPNSPVDTNFDDIIITNTFQISSQNSHCIVVSPIFWTLLVLGIAGIILIIMGILYWMPSDRQHFHCLTRVFRHTDLVGEGELWIGGLMSFAILVLIIFAFWFGSLYAKQYPIETANDAAFACDTSLRNAKFTSSLQLLALLKTQQESTIFQLLDQQNWTLTIDIIQTGFKCEDILVQANIYSYTIKLTVAKCFQQLDNATRTLIVPLTSHLISVQLNFTGNSYIGGTRICLNGPPISDEKSNSSVKKLGFCQLLSNSDQTMPQTTHVKIDCTKVINQTERLNKDDPVIYSGIWVPTLTTKSLNDHIAYEQQGTYLRYLSPQQVLLIELSETQFYIKNTQEPIARSGEILFHNILFSTVCIELFGLAFLIFKLALLPLVQWAVLKIENRHCAKNFHRTRV